MESKGKYVWDPDKQAWVRPSEAKSKEAAGTLGQSAAEVAPASAPRAAKAKAASQAKAVESTVEAKAEPIEEEGELLELPYVTAPIRLLAFIIDAALWGFILWILNIFVPEDNTALGLIVPILMVFVYFAGFWIWRGQTVGKMIVRARVVSADGARVSPVQALLRSVIYLVYYIPFYFLGAYLGGIGVAYLFVLIVVATVLFLMSRREDKRALHDRIAGTAVISSSAEIEVVEE